jgi:hypothetical protein
LLSSDYTDTLRKISGYHQHPCRRSSKVNDGTSNGEEDSRSSTSSAEEFRDVNYVTRREFVTEVLSQSPVYEEYLSPRGEDEEDISPSGTFVRRDKSGSARVSLCEIGVLSARHVMI